MTSITRGPGRTLWWTDFFEQLHRASNDRGRWRFILCLERWSASSESPSDQDGALWFPSFSPAPDLLIILAGLPIAGVITEYPIPTTRYFRKRSRQGPGWRAFGSLSRAQGAGIGRITTDGSVAESDHQMAISSPASRPDQMVRFGPDNQRNTICRMTTSGTITKFQPESEQWTALHHPWAGPDTLVYRTGKHHGASATVIGKIAARWGHLPSAPFRASRRLSQSSSAPRPDRGPFAVYEARRGNIGRV